MVLHLRTEIAYVLNTVFVSASLPQLTEGLMHNSSPPNTLYLSLSPLPMAVLVSLSGSFRLSQSLPNLHISLSLPPLCLSCPVSLSPISPSLNPSSLSLLICPSSQSLPMSLIFPNTNLSPSSRRSVRLPICLASVRIALARCVCPSVCA